jgi:hypothetical protein
MSLHGVPAPGVPTTAISQTYTEEAHSFSRGRNPTRFAPHTDTQLMRRAFGR